MDIIVPCAGLSTRYPGMLPKYVISCYDGKMMLENIVSQYLGKFRVFVTVLKEHDDEFGVVKRLRYIFQDKINITVLDKRTKGSADTVYQTIKQNNITGPFLVRDCDSFFDHDIDTSNNIIYCSHIDGNSKLTQKSYIEFNEQDIISNIVEKKIISEYFCVGGYQFSSADLFCQTFDKIDFPSKEIYLSTIVSNLIENNQIFLKKEVRNYTDLNDLEQFDKYNNKPQYFCDIDGVICKGLSRYDENPFEEYESIQENVDVLLAEQERGCKFVFTTARCEKFYDVTYKMLTELGFKNFKLIMEMTRSKRIVINDYDRLYPTSGHICVKSNVPELKKFI